MRDAPRILNYEINFETKRLVRMPFENIEIEIVFYDTKPNQQYQTFCILLE